jgi:predicted  nucleic acid-binding Zn-ribbon protein
MSENDGWIQRVFGTKPASQRESLLEAAIAERDRYIAEKEQVILDLELRLAALGSELAACGESARAREGDLTRQLETVTAASEALGAELDRSQSSRAAETTQARRQLDSLQASLQGARSDLSTANRRLAVREEELAKKAEQLTDSEWRNQTLEGEIKRLQPEEPKRRALEAQVSALQRDLQAARGEREQQDKRIQELLGSEGTQREQLTDLASQMARSTRRIEELEAGLLDREAHLARVRNALQELSRLSAVALHGAFGDSLHLALELSASRGWQPGIESSREPADVVEQIRRRLSLFGAVVELSLDLSGPVVQGELRLNEACAHSETRALSHWAAAYAIECLNLVLPEPLRLEGVREREAAQGFVFTATRRAVEAPDQLPSGSSGARRLRGASAPDAATRVA